MAPRSKPIAKLSRPRLHGAVPRERLYERLDAALARAALCVVGPPGAGKTTLVASWLEARGLSCIWYQVDSGDADLSTFFYYLQRASEPFRTRRQPPLPLLTPEYRGDLRGFARRFFRQLFELLPARAVVVLDNYQEVATGETFHPIVADAVEEVPADNLLVAISRRDPPDCYARFIANSEVALLDWDALRLTLDETRALAATHGNDEARVHRLHMQCGGWAAGLTLLLENRQEPPVSGVSGLDDLDRVFRYFAAQILDHLEPDTQAFLLETAYLPTLSAGMARELTGNPDAERILDELYRRHLFVHRRPGAEVSYQYHALFQAFLIKRAETAIAESERYKLMCEAGRLLARYGQSEDAFALYAGAGDWTAAATLALREAPAMIAQGRGRTVKEWIAGLPVELREADPSFDYWVGQALLSEDQARARMLFERAAYRFERQGEDLALVLAICAIIDSVYFEWSDFSAMSPCIDRLEPLIRSGTLRSQPEIRIRVHSSLLVAMLYGRPDHPGLAGCVEKVHSMLAHEPDVNLKLSSATFLMTYCSLAVDGERARAIRAAVSEVHEAESVTPLNRLWWLIRDAWMRFRVDQDDQMALDLLDQADEVLEANNLAGLRSASMLIASYRLAILVANNRLQPARLVREAAIAAANPDKRIHEYLTVQMVLKCAIAIDDLSDADRLVLRAREAARRSGMPYVQMQAELLYATVLALRGDIEGAGAVCQCITEMTKGTCFAWFQTEAMFLHALAACRAGTISSAPGLLRIALRHARQTNYSFPDRCVAHFGLLCSSALEAGIETEYVETLIRRFRLPPPCDGVRYWPWPIEIFSLGDFRVMRDAAPIEFGARAPRKVLALLKALVAFGGRNVPQSALLDALWSDEEGDAASNALGVAITRLRKLLECPDAILVQDEQVTLNPKRCWVDAFAFDRLAEDFPDNGDESAAQRFIDRVLDLYRGPFLPAESGQRWSIQMRMRLRERLVRFVERAGARMEAAGQFEAAIRCYRKGLDADDLAEAFYQGLMRCYLALGRPAEGMQVFRRLRQMLSVLLGIAPSRQSESLAESLHECGRAPPAAQPTAAAASRE